MRFVSSSVSLLSVAVASVVLAACTSVPMANHGGHHAVSKGSMGMGQMGHKDMMSMCPMHEQMMGSKTPEERKAIMAEHMRTMSPEMREMHLQRMQEHTSMMKEVMATQPATHK
jgi:hypothetical protein